MLLIGLLGEALLCLLSEILVFRGCRRLASFHLITFLTLFHCVLRPLALVSVRLFRVVWLSRVLLVSVILLSILILGSLKLTILLFLALINVVLVVTVVDRFVLVLLWRPYLLRVHVGASLTLSTLVGDVNEVVWVDTLKLFLHELDSIVDVVLGLYVTIRYWSLWFVFLSLYLDSLLYGLWLKMYFGLLALAHSLLILFNVRRWIICYLELLWVVHLLQL